MEAGSNPARLHYVLYKNEGEIAERSKATDCKSVLRGFKSHFPLQTFTATLNIDLFGRVRRVGEGSGL